MEGVSSKLIADRMEQAGKGPVWEGPRSEAAERIAGRAKSGDVVITVGAGDITRTGPELLELLERAG